MHWEKKTGGSHRKEFCVFKKKRGSPPRVLLLEEVGSRFSFCVNTEEQLRLKVEQVSF